MSTATDAPSAAETGKLRSRHLRTERRWREKEKCAGEKEKSDIGSSEGPSVRPSVDETRTDGKERMRPNAVAAAAAAAA